MQDGWYGSSGMYFSHSGGVRPPAVVQILLMAYWTFRSQSRVVPSSPPLAGVPIAAERYRVDGDAAGQGLAQRLGVRRIGDIPQPDGAVEAAAGQHAPIAAERHRADGGGTTGRGSPAWGCAGSAISHSRTVPSRAPLASVPPWWSNATVSRVPIGIRPCCRGCAGSATPHSRVPSTPAAASIRPSRLNATEPTAPPPAKASG